MEWTGGSNGRKEVRVCEAGGLHLSSIHCSFINFPLLQKGAMQTQLFLVDVHRRSSEHLRMAKLMCFARQYIEILCVRVQVLVILHYVLPARSLALRCACKCGGMAG